MKYILYDELYEYLSRYPRPPIGALPWLVEANSLLRGVRVRDTADTDTPLVRLPVAYQFVSSIETTLPPKAKKGKKKDGLTQKQ